jgi:hypothetical protein
MRPVDFSYVLSEERIRAYLEVPEIERLRWLEDMVRLTLMWRAAPEMRLSQSSADDSGKRDA